jgi:FAD/FMN-containing dehydrogenase
MRRILRSLDADGEITVEPGVPVATLRSVLGAQVFAGASPSATVGGHVASIRGLRGLTGIELVEPDGGVAHSDVRHPGYDFAGAFCGSRGVAGIAVSISLRAAEL